MSKTEECRMGPISEGLMNRRTVVLTGEINDDLIDRVARQLIALQMQSPDRINLIIDSGGGATYSALKLCDLMSTVLTAPIRGIVLGSCGSAATFVLLYCTERLGTPYSQFLIHSGTASEISIPINQSTSDNLEQLLRDVKRTEEEVVRLYMNRLTPVEWANRKPTSEKRRKFVQQLIDRGDQRFDRWLPATEAHEVGLISEIVQEKLDIFNE